MTRRTHRFSLRKSSLLEGLVAYWPLNEMDGVQSGYDHAGGHDLVYTAGTAPLTVAAGNTYQLAREITPWVEIEVARLTLNDPAIRLATSHTWATWFNPYSEAPYSEPHTYNCLWSWLDGSGGERLLLTNAQQLAWQAAAGAGGTDNRSLHVGIPDPFLNSWHLSICEYDHATKIYKQLIDNTSELVDDSGGLAFRNSSAIGLTVLFATDEGSWDGCIGPLMYWNRILSSQEKSDLWNGGVGWELYGMRQFAPQRRPFWWQANETIPDANIIEHVENPAAGNGYVGGTLSSAWTIAIRATWSGSLGQYAFDAQTGRLVIGLDAVGSNGIYVGSWINRDLFVTSEAVYFIVSNGSSIQAYRNNAAVGDPINSAVDIGGAVRWRSNYNNAAVSTWTGAMPRAAVYNIALDAAQRSALYASMSE